MLDACIDELLRVGGSVVQKIGLWEGIRPPVPQTGHARINVLAPSGLYFGQGPPADPLSKDHLGGPVLAAAFELMQKISRPRSPSYPPRRSVRFCGSSSERPERSLRHWGPVIP